MIKLKDAPYKTILSFMVRRKSGSKINTKIRDVWCVKLSDSVIGIQLLAYIDDHEVRRVVTSLADPLPVTVGEDFELATIGSKYVIHEAK